jgi:hypothetical protein
MMSGQLHAPAALPQRKSPWYPLDRRLDGCQNWSEHDGEEKIPPPLLGLEPPIIQPVAQCYITEIFLIKSSVSLVDPNSHNDSCLKQVGLFIVMLTD